MNAVYLLLISLIFASCGSDNQELSQVGMQTMGAFSFNDSFKIIAHRGASGRAPENTFAAIHAAKQLRADMIELDFGNTMDGEFYLLHDSSLNRTTNAEEVLGVGDHLLSETQSALVDKLDAGSWFFENFSGLEVPRLNAALKLRSSNTPMLIEQKSGEAKDLAHLLEEATDLDNVVVQSFDWEFLRQLKNHLPQISIVALGSLELSEEKLEAAKNLGAIALNWQFRHLDEETVKRVHNHGLRILAFTVNHWHQARRLKEMGVDGVVTNYPDRMREAEVF